jgi:sortase B
MDKKKKIYVILLVICVLVLIGSVATLIRNYQVKKNADEIYEELANDSNNTQESDSENETQTLEESSTQDNSEIEEDILTQLGITVPEKTLDWDALYEENEDIYAWIYIPNTQVDYPILQHPTDADYYINYNIDGTKGYPGCICSQYYNSKDFRDPNTILYGHNMKNGTMFKTLHNFEDKEFFDENPYIYIYTPDITYVYEIFAACSVSDSHLMFAYDFWDSSDFSRFVNDISNSRGMTNQLRDDVNVYYGNYLLTLSTCISGQSDKRWIVVGKRLN